MATEQYSIRRARLEDPVELAAIIALCGSALGWRAGEPNEAFFRWKHLGNPAGPSPMWVAEHDGHLVGVRAMLRWTFLRDGAEVQAVRAVDTATHPDWQGRGIFRALTMRAIEELRDEGVAFVFNTPNAQSRPGYVKMGWQILGRVPVRFVPRSPGALVRLLRSRQPAAKWSRPLTVGSSPAERFGLGAPSPANRDGVAPGSALLTARTPAFLTWRYGFAPLAYRVIETDGAAVVVRVRDRGSATELVLASVLAGDGSAARRAIAAARRGARADYVLATATTAGVRTTMLPAPRQGPVLTVRALASDPPSLDHLRLELGDLELF